MREIQTGLSWSLFARRYWENVPRRSGAFFLFLCVLWCFASAGSLPSLALGINRVCTAGVSPFGNLGIKGCLSPPPSLSQTDYVLHRLPVPRHPPSAYKQLPWLAINNFNFLNLSGGRKQQSPLMAVFRAVKLLKLQLFKKRLLELSIKFDVIFTDNITDYSIYNVLTLQSSCVWATKKPLVEAIEISGSIMPQKILFASFSVFVCVYR